jgi:hypothetical protein
MATDNTPTHAWISRGSTTSISSPAFLLSQLASDCQTCNAVLTTMYTPGKSNSIADFLSRSFALSDHDVLSRLQIMAPIQPPWKLATPTERMICTTNWALSRKLPPMASVTPGSTATAHHGQYGRTSVTTSPATPSCKTLQIPSPCSKYSLSDTAWVRWLPPPLQSKLEQWKTPFVPLDRRSPHWGSGIPGCNPLGSLTSAFIDNSNATQKMTHPPTELNRCHSSYSMPLSHIADELNQRPPMPLQTC